MVVAECNPLEDLYAHTVPVQGTATPLLLSVLVLSAVVFCMLLAAKAVKLGENDLPQSLARAARLALKLPSGLW